MKIRWIIVGALTSFAVTFALVFIIAAVAYFTDLSENAAGVCAYAAAAGVFAGAHIAASNAGRRAFFHALAVSLLYIAAMIAASFALNGGVNTDIHCVSIMTGALLAGFLGAVTGKNTD